MASQMMERRYLKLEKEIGDLLEQARAGAARAINTLLVATYWEVGRRIVEFEQKGKERAEYGEGVLRRLSEHLRERFGRGFGLSNLKVVRAFFLAYPKGQTPSGLSGDPGFLLPWSHYVRLLGIKDAVKRAFYEEEARRGNWSVRQLDRQIDAMFYERVALAKDKSKLLSAAPTGEVTPAGDAVKDPYVLEFLGLPEQHSERDLETALIIHLQEFLLELGHDFTFVARQKRVQIGSQSFYMDLVFYHRRLRALVVFDLKLGRFTHADAGQMNLYLNFLREHDMLPGERPPIGIILCSEKDDAVARYALGGLEDSIFAAQYQLLLPKPEVLTREIDAERRRLEERRLLDAPASPRRKRPPRGSK